MAKSIAKSCPLCLNVDDPAGMLPVMMTHSTPAQSAPMYLCRLCVLEIIKSAVGSDLFDPSEVFGDVSPAGTSDPKINQGHWDAGIKEATGPHFYECEHGKRGDEVCTECDAGGEDGEPAPEKG